MGVRAYLHGVHNVSVGIVIILYVSQTSLLHEYVTK